MFTIFVPVFLITICVPILDAVIPESTELITVDTMHRFGVSGSHGRSVWGDLPYGGFILKPGTMEHTEVARISS